MPIPIPTRPKLSMEVIQKRVTSNDGVPWPEESFEEAYQHTSGWRDQSCEITSQRAQLKESIEAIHIIINRHRILKLGGYDLDCMRAHLHNAQEAVDVLEQIRQHLSRNPPLHGINLTAPRSSHESDLRR